MKIYPVTAPVFRHYGRILDGFDTSSLLDAMAEIPLPGEGMAYKPSIETLEAVDLFPALRDRAYGGMPIQLGMCWGRNTKLNCLEYHRDSELNVGTHDFILLLAREDEIENGMLDTGKVLAFQIPAGVLVEVYATTLHYAPCHVSREDGFRVAVVLPKGTNTEKPDITPAGKEDRLLWARNKWLLAHPESSEAKKGAYTGLTGINIDIAET
ncbi:MAG: DUF4867 family protein [Oscillospiraceae bacterium]|nr:DUF4867 family protein [Oscillospiraceae bacterium]